MNLETLLYDVVMRVPNIQIVYNGDSYYLLDENKKIKISKSWIGYLITYNYAKRNSYGGIVITEKGIELAQSIELQKIKVESQKHKGMFYDAFINPRKCYET